MPVYRDNFEHLMHELRRLDLILQRNVIQFRAQRNTNLPDAFRGLHISDDEIDELMADVTSSQEEVDHSISKVKGDVKQHQVEKKIISDANQKTPGESLGGPRDELHSRIHTLHAEIRQRIAESQKAGIFLRLPHLSAVFGLNSFETDLLLLALAPELDLRYQKLYAYLQDDVTRKRPSVDLALRLFIDTADQRLKMRNVFYENAPLVRFSLLSIHEEPAERPLPLIARSLKMNDRIVQFLLGSDRLDAHLTGGVQMARWITPQVELSELVLPQETKSSLQRIIPLVASGQPWLCLLQGPAGCGKKSVAEGLCKALKRSLLVLDLSAMLKSESPFMSLLHLGFREARLYGSAIYLHGWHDLIKDEPRYHTALRLVLQEVEHFPGLVFAGSRSLWRPTDTLRCNFVCLELTRPTDNERRLIWEKHFHNGFPVNSEVNPDRLASIFRFTPGQIRQALTHAQTHARLRQGKDYRITMEDLIVGCRIESTRHLISFAQKITSRRVWQDLVLPKDILAQLREFCHQVHYRMKVYGEWGFGGRLSLGKGTIALFAGPSGTGKTLSAEIMANELGLDLYKVDLSSVISKYIGETEKNLSRVFQDARESNAILFFDEADALFGKRTEVKDAHDRYANIEINFLLQQVEEYEGVVILASNMKKNIDEAFLRRLHFHIEFPFPDESLRRRIWKGIFPPQAPVSEEVDFDFLARKFKIAGGNIKNVALTAAFFAAEDGEVIGMKHIILAMKREYQKLGKVCEKIEFEKYYELVRL